MIDPQCRLVREKDTAVWIPQHAKSCISYFQNDLADAVQSIGGCTCGGVEVKDGVVYVKHHHLLALAGWIQHLDLGILYPFSEPFLQGTLPRNWN